MNCILNFKVEFAAAVEAGVKRTTFRMPRADGRDPEPGDTLYLYTGLRTKGTRKLREETCTEVRELTVVQVSPERFGILDGADLLDDGVCEAIARDDGFKTFEAMARFLDDLYGLPVTGNLIAWTPMLKYELVH